MSADIRRTVVSGKVFIPETNLLPDVLLLAAPTKSVPYLFLRKKLYAIAYFGCAMAFLFYISKKIIAGGCVSPNSTGSLKKHSPAFNFAGGTEIRYCLYGECTITGFSFFTGFDFYWRDADGHFTSTGRKSHNSSRLNNNFAGAEVIPLTGSVSANAPAFNLWGGHGINSTGRKFLSLTPFFLPADAGSYLIRGVSDNRFAGYKFSSWAGYGRENLYGEELSSEVSRHKFSQRDGCGISISYGQKINQSTPQLYEMNKNKKEG